MLQPEIAGFVGGGQDGGPVRAVVQACGIPNVLTKSMGSSNHIAVVNATVHALQQLRMSNDIAEMRKQA